MILEAIRTQHLDLKARNGTRIGANCESPILRAIEVGLESALARSYVLVFTNKLPSDFELELTVVQIIEEKQSSVYVLLTNGGGCRTTRDSLEYRTYERITYKSNGLLLELEKNHMGQMLRKLPELLNNQNVLIVAEKKARKYTRFLVDNSIKMLTVTTPANATFTILDAQNKEAYQAVLMHTSNKRIIQITKPAPGLWSMPRGSPEDLRITGLSGLHLDFGFSLAPVEFFNQTSYSPTVGMKNVLTILPQNVDTFGSLSSVRFNFPSGPENPLELQLKYNETTKLFVTEPFQAPRHPFKLSVQGKDEHGYDSERILSPELEGAIGPPPDIIFSEESRIITAGGSLRLSCRIRSFGVASSLMLKNGEKRLLQMTFSDVDPRIVHDIAVVEVSDSGNYSCSARNEFGTREKTVQLTVLERPSQMELIGEPIEGRRRLEIRCIPVAGQTIHWTVNGTSVDKALVRSQFELFGNNLILRQVHRNMSGDYSCIHNSSSKLSIDVQYPVERVTVADRVILFEINDLLTVNCGLIGNPKPTVEWLQPGAFIFNGDIVLTADARTDGRILTCTGSSAISPDRVTNTIRLRKKLSVEMTQTPDPVLDGGDVELTCRYVTTEAATVAWSVNGLDAGAFGSGIIQRGASITIRNISADDPITVECLVATTHDSVKGTKKVQVDKRRFPTPPSNPITPPTPPKTILSGRTETAPVIDERSFADYYLLDESTDHITVECRARGNPTPRIYWTHQGQFVKEGAKLNLTLSTDDGEYYCKAESSAGKAMKLLIVERQLPPVNAIEEVVNVDEGEAVNYSCPISRNRQVSPNDILWTSDKLNYRGENLILVHASHSDTGSYSCCLPKGRYCAIVKLYVKPKRIQHDVINRYVELAPGQHLNLQCEGFFSFGARFEWWRSGRQVDTARALILPGNKESEGAYKCLSSDESNEYEVQYQVVYKEPPKITRIIRDPINNVFSCEATGHPEPVLAWLHKRTKIVATTLIQYGMDMLLDHLRRGELIIVNADGSGHVTKHPEQFFVKQQPRDKPFGLLQQINSRMTLKWIGAPQNESTGDWTCVAMNKWGTTNESVVVSMGMGSGGLLQQRSVLFQGEPEHENHMIVRGLPLILECRSHGGGNHDEIKWSKDDLPIGDNRRAVLTMDNGNRLVIAETTMYDAGTYTCQLQSEDGKLKKSFHVVINEPPEIKEANGSGRGGEDDQSIIRLTVIKGRSTVLQCPIVGTPEPVITWSQLVLGQSQGRKVIPIYTKGPRLTVSPQLETEHYQCSGSSTMGNTQVLFEVVTEFKPVFKNQNSLKLNPKLFSSVLLPCWADANPVANITWLHNNKILLPGMRVRISANNQVVKVSNLRSEDNGVYVCTAENSLGRVTKSFTLQVTVPTLLSPWSKWTNCSTPCGLGTRQRFRECVFWNGETAPTDNTPQCAGEKLETEECLVTECPVNGEWSEWTQWSPCSRTCKTALVEHTPSIKYRHRDCTNPAPAFGGSSCKGSSYQQEICEVPFCPINGGWSEFSDWSSCSATCGLGMQVRNRICNSPVPQFNGRDCAGESFEVKHCQRACAVQEVVAADWSLWGDWTECSVACGSGMRSRTRNCLRPDGECAGENIEFQQCDGRICEARAQMEEEEEEDNVFAASTAWLYKSPARTEKFLAMASASISSSEEEDSSSDDSSSRDIDGQDQLSRNYFNPKVSITLESSIPLTGDITQIHFASASVLQPVPDHHRNESCELGFEFRQGLCQGKSREIRLIMSSSRATGNSCYFTAGIGKTDRFIWLWLDVPASDSSSRECHNSFTGIFGCPTHQNPFPNKRTNDLFKLPSFRPQLQQTSMNVPIHRPFAL